MKGISLHSTTKNLPNCFVSGLMLQRSVLIVIFFLLFYLPCRAQSEGPLLTIHKKNLLLTDVFREIQRQGGYTFSYNDKIFQGAERVTLDLEQVSIERVLDEAFKGQGFKYLVVDRVVAVKRAVVEPTLVNGVVVVNVTGKVVNDKGEAVARATVTVRDGNKSVFADEEGVFKLKDVDVHGVLFVSSVGYEGKEVGLGVGGPLVVQLKQAINYLDETVVIAYGATTRRLNTGSVAKVTKEDLEKQPVSNPLAALSGRVPGLIITQSNGLPGSYFKVQIRGQNSILKGSDPLFVIDGVPFAANNIPLNQVTSAADVSGNPNSGLSPFNLINPADIESIEILKDADATSIYGSRGANGVILITTKKGKAGKAKFNVSAYQGGSVVTRTMQQFRTPEYLSMRHEGFSNDRVAPSATNAPDLLVWDTTRYTDFKKLLIGGTANVSDAQASMTVGSDAVQVLFGGSFHRETTVFPGDLSDVRGTLYVNAGYTSKKLSLNFTANYARDRNHIISQDLTANINLPPDYPALQDAQGQLNWQYKESSLTTNPLAYLLYSYTARTTNLLTSLQFSYKLTDELMLKASAGTNSMNVSEVSILPIAAQNPLLNPTGFAQFGDRNLRNWIVEPQLGYIRKIGLGKLDALAGVTFQSLTGEGAVVAASGYKDDALLWTTNGASDLNTLNNNSLYRYEAFFGRLNYNWDNKYLVNLAGRRDGSSRFGSGRQFSNFSSVGMAWIFSNESFSRSGMPFISYGKVRGSYGITGNDQIGDYQYLDSWTRTSNTYEGMASLYPTRLYNPNYSWEQNAKLEVAMDLGFWRDRLLLSVAFFRNRGGNELISYTLPAQTGFTSITKNFPALIQNTGLELSLTTKNVVSRSFNWTTAFNITLPKNKLLSFPNIEASSYDGLVVGQPLSIVGGYHYLGVDKESGLYRFEDVNKDGQISYENDYFKNIGNLDPTFYGGMNNGFSFKNWQVDVFLEFKKQLGQNYLFSYYNDGLMPGTMNNQPVSVAARWQKAGDASVVQRYTAGYNSAAYLAAYELASSAGSYTDASYVRLKNVSVSYNVTSGWLKRMDVRARFYVHAQNLVTWTRYNGADPEVQSYYVLPPLKTIAGGLQVVF